MKKLVRTMPALTLLNTVFFIGSVSTAGAKETKILEFDKMVGVPTGMIGTKAPIRGINGGSVPWMIGSGSGELTASGHLELEVQGLAFAAGPNVGKNTVANFKAIVSCLDANGVAQNIPTDLFPATLGAAADGSGNAKFETDLSLPQPCIAPLIFVTSPGGSWFATIGN